MSHSIAPPLLASQFPDLIYAAVCVHGMGAPCTLLAAYPHNSVAQLSDALEAGYL